jgi:hypothetical protein
LKYFLTSALFFFFVHTIVFAQEADVAAADARNAVANVSAEQRVKLLVAQMSTASKNELQQFFLSKESAYQLAAQVYQGTEIGQYDFQLEKVAALYHEISNEAYTYFLEIYPSLKTLAVSNVDWREGATEHMSVLVVRLNAKTAKETPFGFRVNMVATPNGLVILNLKN